MFIKRVLCCGLLAGSLLCQEKPSTENPSFQWEPVLKAARAYCQRLGKAALDFVCQEEVVEIVRSGRDDLERGIRVSGAGGVGEFVGARPSMAIQRPDYGRAADMVKETSSVYDYQFVRQDGKVTEKRELIKRNGKKPRQNDDQPPSVAFQYVDILMSPVSILDERFSEFYDFRLVGPDAVEGTKAWIIEVSPRFSLVGSYLGGKIWLDQATGAVLRIEWDPKTFGNYDKILFRAKSFNAAPQVVSRTEFGFEKNGLRFPSLDTTEEAYLFDKDDTPFVRASTRVVYKEYKFFTVETQSEVRK